MDVEPIEHLRASLSRELVVALCVDESGVACVDTPPALAAHGDTFVRPDHPLDLIDDGSHPDAIATFLTAMEAGVDSAAVVDTEGRDRLLEVVDVRDDLGCLVCVLSDGEAASEERRTPSSLPVRRYALAFDAAGRVIRFDEAYSKMFGWSEADVLGQPAMGRVHPDDRAGVIATFGRLLKDGPGAQSRYRQRVLSTGGEYRWIEVTQTNLLDADQPEVFCEGLDISDEMAAYAALEEREQLLAEIAEGVPVAMLHLDRTRTPTLWNDRWQLMTGCDPALGLGALAEVVADPDHFRLGLVRMAGTSADAAMEIELSPDIDQPTRIRHGVLRHRRLRTDECLVTIEDVSEIMSTRKELEHHLRRDPLTGTLNRRGLEEVIGRAVRDRDPSSEPFALVYVDLDRFKAINDTRGHSYGDQVLVAAARAIEGALRHDDVVGRIGGDEFVALVHDDVAARPADLDTRIRGRLDAAVDTEGEPLHLAASVGVARAVRGDDLDSLLRRADSAMYRSKRGLNPAPPPSTVDRG